MFIFFVDGLGFEPRNAIRDTVILLVGIFLSALVLQHKRFYIRYNCPAFELSFPIYKYKNHFYLPYKMVKRLLQSNYTYSCFLYNLFFLHYWLGLSAFWVLIFTLHLTEQTISSCHLALMVFYFVHPIFLIIPYLFIICQEF